MKGYGQFCPIARASEVLAERWTPIIVRNLLLGCTTFNEIASGAPGLSRALLAKRLRELEHVGVIEIHPKEDGRGSVYEMTRAGQELWDVLRAMGGWALQWLEVRPEHDDPDVVLWSWCHGFLVRDRLPDIRVLVRFEFEAARMGRPARGWMLIQDRDAEICSKHPGFEEDMVVLVSDSLAFAEWHLGLLEWDDALRSGGIRVEGPRELRRALPTWNAGPQVHARIRNDRRDGSPRSTVESSPRT
jgi:DNA-binding HxlR family transcriptional regulator